MKFFLVPTQSMGTRKRTGNIEGVLRLWSNAPYINVMDLLLMYLILIAYAY